MNLKDVRKALLKGEIVILPTETVYGLACLERHAKKMYAIKNRPADMAVARVYSSAKAVINDNELSEFSRIVVQKLLPGPFTLLINGKSGAKLGVRVPENKAFVDCIKGLKKPIIMSSCNLHGGKPALTFAEAKALFPTLEGVDGGTCKYGKSSMIIDLTNERD